MKDIKRLLTILTEAIPPSGKARHNITLNNGQLELCIMFKDKFYPFILETEDYEMSPQDLADDIIKYMYPIMEVVAK